MNVTIHRGTAQIGGCCTEIRTDKARIFIDLGQELPAPGVHAKPLAIDGLTQGEPNCDGVFFTHYHGDHVGLYADALPGIPLYMGKASKEIFLALQTHRAIMDKEIQASLPQIENICTYVPDKAIQVGDIRITPYFTDHSAYDAYMFLIEAEGKRILHTGDFRTHGYLGKGVLRMLRHYVGQVDILITEGTTLSRSDQEPESERDLQRRLSGYAEQYKYIFLLCSSTNIDRLASAHAVAKGRGIPFLCDRYQKDVLGVVTAQSGSHELYRFDHVGVLGEKPTSRSTRPGFLMAVRTNPKYLRYLDKYSGPDSILLYSMWKGYTTTNKEVADFLEGRSYEYLHTSGHASPTQIKAVCETVKPKLGVIPIHTEAPERLADICKPCTVIQLRDRQEYVI